MTPSRGKRLALGLALNLVLCTPGSMPASRAESTGIDMSVDDGGTVFAAGEAAVRDWTLRSATIVKQYYGYFPAHRLKLRLHAVDGASVRSGHTRVSGSAVIDITLGRDVTGSALLHDWVLVHEMVHLALPDVGASHNWLAEGVATYVEGVARVQAGNMTEVELWLEYVEQMPKGLPAAGDGGLDQTASWARTYWGGALFCLLADVKIREQTQGRDGLQDALRVIGRDGGMSTADDIERLLAVGDAATGTHVLGELYAAMRSHPMTPDLAALWRDLGIRRVAGSVNFDDAAPLAAVRRAITARHVTAQSNREPRDGRLFPSRLLQQTVERQRTGTGDGEP